jgi:hypothetical protein
VHNNHVTFGHVHEHVFSARSPNGIFAVCVTCGGIDPADMTAEKIRAAREINRTGNP